MPSTRSRCCEILGHVEDVVVRDGGVVDRAVTVTVTWPVSVRVPSERV